MSVKFQFTGLTGEWGYGEGGCFFGALIKFEGDQDGQPIRITTDLHSLTQDQWCLPGLPGEEVDFLIPHHDEPWPMVFMTHEHPDPMVVEDVLWRFVNQGDVEMVERLVMDPDDEVGSWSWLKEAQVILGGTTVVVEEVWRRRRS